MAIPANIELTTLFVEKMHTQRHFPASKAFPQERGACC